MAEYLTSPIYDGGETGTNQDATDTTARDRRWKAVHSNEGRHRWNPGRSIPGATATPFANRAEPGPAAPAPPPEIHPPNGRGINPS